MEMITISKDEYDELRQIKRYAEERESINKKTGAAWQKYQELKALDEFCTKMYPSYSLSMKKEFRAMQKRNN